MPTVKSYYKVLRVLPDPDFFYIQNEYSGTNTFTVDMYGTPASTDLSYSTDKVTWTDIHAGGNVTMSNLGDKIYLRSSTGFSLDPSNRFVMFCDNPFSIHGSVATLFDYTDVNSVTSIPAYGLYGFFGGQRTLVGADFTFYPITTLGRSACQEMFYDLNSMTSVPNMSSITTIGQEALKNSFTRTAITTPPDMSGVTTIGQEGCSNMFTESSITSTPDLSSVTSIGVSGCSYMFSECYGITTGADLSNVISVGGSSLSRMYVNCSNLNSATAPNINSWSIQEYTGTAQNWLYGTASTGIVYKPANLTIQTDTPYGIPTGWTSVDY